MSNHVAFFPDNTDLFSNVWETDRILDSSERCCFCLTRHWWLSGCVYVGSHNVQQYMSGIGRGQLLQPLMCVCLTVTMLSHTIVAHCVLHCGLLHYMEYILLSYTYCIPHTPQSSSQPSTTLLLCMPLLNSLLPRSLHSRSKKTLVNFLCKFQLQCLYLFIY